MASERALTIRRAAVLDRIAAAAATLADRYALSVSDALTQPPMKDPDMGRVLQLEAFADVLDGLAAATMPQEDHDDGGTTQPADAQGSPAQGKQAKASAKAKVAS